ncbi:alpha/beta fold hydrolase [Streptomyces sp. NBC_00209]|uniref:alpha/beta fold hydrolase n=1 Tax=Streptomyces sp. NBC_00209 TaxID=2975682 RepID=UPI00324DCF64
MSLSRRIAGTAFKPWPVSRKRAMAVGERLAAVTTLTSSLEYLTQRHHIRRGGLNDWEVVKDIQRRSTPLTRRLLDLVSGEHTTTAVHAARVAVSAGMLLPGASRWRGAGSLFLGASSALLYPRHRYGTDGSDQVSVLVHAAVGVARLSDDPRSQDAALWYIALQSNLSYLVSGWVKLMGPSWRDASALGGVMRTRTYGHEGAFELTQKYPRTARYVAHGVLALECLFPLAYVGGGRLVRPVVACAAAFHVTNGFAMGLGRFITAFVAMHPAVAYTAAPRSHPSVAGRDDRALAVGGAVLALAASAAGVLTVQRRLRSREGWTTSRTLTTGQQNVLQYEVMSEGERAKPVVVFCNGLGTPSEHFSWMSEAIARRSGYGVITFARAGYAGSSRRCTGPYALSESVDDLVDLVRGAVPADRKVVLAGHSLGGELCRRAAVRLGDRLHSVVYLDSAHPAELNRSRQQGESAQRLRETLTMMVWSLRLGMGAWMCRPDWLESLAEAYRPRAFAQYCDLRTWVTARREWAAVEADFGTFGDDLTSIDAPALVISAQQTIDRDPEQLLLHNELAHAHRGGDHRVESMVVEGASHEALLVDAQYALQVADHIIGFLDATMVGVAAFDPAEGQKR